MPLSELKTKAKVIGTKQVKKALSRGLVQKVYLADDAEPHITCALEQLCRQCKVETVRVESMRILGNACGIEVGSAVVAILLD